MSHENGFRAVAAPLILLLLAAGVRVIGVSGFAVWTDEGWTVWATEHLPDLLPTIAGDRHPPLYFLALGLWQEVAGLSRLALRMPSVWSGLLLVALTWRVGRRLAGNWAALYAAALVAVAPVAVYYTQEVRHFGLHMLTVVLCSWLFLRALRRPTTRRLALYGMSVALAMYTLYMAFFVIVIQVGVVFVAWGGSLRDKARFVGAWALALGLFAPWLYVILRWQMQLLGFGIAGVGNVADSGPGALMALLRDLLGNGVALLAVLWVVALAALVRGWQATPHRVERLYVVLWALGTFALMAAINTQFTLFRLRTVTMLIPAFALLAAFGLVALPRRAANALFVVVLALTIYRELPVQPRGAMPELAAALAEDYQPGDLIVVETGWSDDEFIYEIRRAVGWDADVIRTLQWVDGRGPNKLVVLEIEDRLRAAERIWVIHWNQPPQVVPWLQGDDQPYDEVRYTRHGVGPEVEQYMDGYFARVDGGYRLYLFEQNPPPSASGSG